MTATTPTLLRGAAWAVLWDAAARRHVCARDVDMLLADGRIAAIGPTEDAPPPAGAAVIDARRMLVMPGS